MNTITLAHFFSYIADILLIIYIIGRNPGARTNNLCAFLIMTFSVWSLCYGLGTMAHSSQEALYFYNAGAVGWSIFPVAAVWFYLAVAQQEHILRNKAGIALSIVLPAFFLYNQWTGNLINDSIQNYWGWSAIWSFSIYSYIYLAYVIIAISICALSIIQYGRQAQTVGQKKQARLLLITGGLAVILGIGTAVLYQLLDIKYIPQAADILVMIWAAGIVFTISLYNLMSITPANVANQILAIMNEAIMLLDSGGKIIYANHAATILHKRELKNVDFQSIVNDESKAADLLEETRAKGTRREMEMSYLLATGKTVPVLVSATALHESPDSIAGFVVSATDISEKKCADTDLMISYEMLYKTYHDAVDTIARIMDMRDPYTGGHQLRVAGLASAIAQEMNLSDEQVDNLCMAATVHDIGKINIAAEILNKPGSLSKIEFDIIKAHAQGGYEIVSGLDLPCTIAEAIWQHHERLDGSGYPRGLKKTEILIEARILAVADVIEAMTSHRPYRPALGLNKALEEVSMNRNKLYDPDVVDACIKLFNEKKFSLA